MTSAPREDIATPGLRAPVEITIDTWGIPHIRAQNLHDLFFAQGFNAARDRLWQLDLARKRGLGLLAADFGPGYIEQDRAARLFLYRGDMAAEWACYGEDAEAICTAFADGINAYVDLVERESARLPEEFALLGTRPGRWIAADVVRVRTHGWVRNALSEVARANVMARAGAQTDLLRVLLEPHVEPHVADGFDLASIPPEALEIYKLAASPVSFDPLRMSASLAQAAHWRCVSPTGQVIFDTAMHGSNNWVIDGRHTSTGRPIMANDPHRAHAVPSLRYIVHLTAPGFDAIGAGEPLLPGIVFGHNGHSAFGMTLFCGPDEEDVYVYDTQPGHPDRYRYGDGWEAMRVIEERVTVKGVPDQLIRLKFTRHGPVIHEDPSAHRAYAVRTVLTEPGTAPYAGSLLSMRARSFEAFRAAMRHWAVPALNQVYADAGGDIGWVVAGWSPVRDNWDGLLPVPGDGRYEWKGMLKPDELPWVHNPKCGFFTTSNEMNVPPDWPIPPERIGFEWWEPSRSRRIREVLGGQSAHGIADSQALQTDVVSMPARRMMKLFATLRAQDEDAVRALAVLRGWDCRLAADSGPAALFELWWTAHLRPAVIARLVPDPALRELVLAPGDVESILRAVEAPSAALGDAGERDALLLASLAAAYRETAGRLGADPGAWAWGALHRGTFAHALNPLQSAPDRTRFNVGPLPQGGGASTPMMATYRTPDCDNYFGASVRIVVDVGGWDNSVCINAPGQSGDRRSPHYADLAAPWARGAYVPLLYSQEAVARAAESRLVLRPA